MENNKTVIPQKILDAQSGSGNMGDVSFNKVQNEIKKIRSKGRVDAGKLMVKDFADHYNISLWSKEGKRIGPLHPHNAEKAFMQFYNLGVQLSVDKPTVEEVAAYKETDEYKVKEKAYREVRVGKDQSKKKGNMEKLVKQMAELTGQSIEALQGVAKQAGGAAPAGAKAHPGHHVDRDMTGSDK